MHTTQRFNLINIHIIKLATMKTLTDLIIEKIEGMTSSELLDLNNSYCQSANYSDDEIYSNDEEFFNTFFEGKPMEVARACFYGDYNFSHDYVKFNGYGNLETISSIGVDDLVDSVSVLADYIAENQSDFDSLFDFDELESELVEENNED